MYFNRLLLDLRRVVRLMELRLQVFQFEVALALQGHHGLRCYGVGLNVSGRLVTTVSWRQVLWRGVRLVRL